MADSPERPARGLPPEEALERWSDPEAYAAMREYWDARVRVSVATGGKPSPKVLRHQEYRRRRDPLEEKLHASLEEGRLLATAVGKNADPTAARTIVDPAVFQDASIGWERDDLRGHTRAYELELVEVFEPPGVPRNVRVIPDWYWREYEPPTDPVAEREAQVEAPPRGVDAAGFTQHADYRHVTLNGVEFSLTRTQATIVRLLHEAHLRGDAWRYGPHLLEEAGSRSFKLFQVFRRMANWTELIESDGRGYYRLRLPPPDRG